MQVPSSKSITGAAMLTLCALAIGAEASSKRVPCQADECELRAEHFNLYSSIKRALDSNFSMKGKDVVPLVRSVEVLKRRFQSQPQGQQQLNGTKLVLTLLENDKLRAALDTFESDEGRALIAIYRGSINGGHHQNLACSAWRVAELEFAGRQLERHPKLAQTFANIHRNFLERSARRCLKSACSSIDDNMNRLDSVQRQPSRRKGFVAREEAFTGKLFEEGESSLSPANNNALDEHELVAQLAGDNEPPGEFQREERALCRFFKRTNQTQCQASGNELSEINFLKPITVNNITVQANLGDFLADQDKNAGFKVEPTNSPLGQCRALQPLLEYHLAGLRWFQRRDLISSHKLQARTFWCPSLAYWLELERLCQELEVKLAASKPAGETTQQGTFAY